MSVHVERSSVHPGDRPAPAAGPGPLRVRLTGLGLAAGALTWTVTLIMAGEKVKEESTVAETLGSMAFLLGLLPFVALLLAVRASGDRTGRAVAIVELALLVPAMAWCVLTVVFGDDAPGWMVALDLTWPLSQLTMLILGVCVMRAGRLSRSLRLHVLAGGLWLVAAMLSQGLLGTTGGTAVGAGWLVVTYAAIGVRLAARPAGALPAR